MSEEQFTAELIWRVSALGVWIDVVENTIGGDLRVREDDSPAVGPGSINLDRAFRKLCPSTSKLTFNPLFRSAVNAFDVIPRLIFPEFRALPPNHLRIRVGVGNRIFNNQTHFLLHARDFWMFVFSEGVAGMQSDILDIGVGCGRWAHWLRDYNFSGRRFSGTLCRRRYRRGSNRMVQEAL